MRLTSIVIRVVRIALPVSIGYGLGRSLPGGAAWAAASSLAVGLPVLGALLLRFSQPGTVTWRNYAGGWLMPFGYALGGGKLPRIVVACAILWFGLAAAGLLAARSSPTVGAPGAEPTPTVMIALVGGWIVDGLVFVYLLGVLSKLRVSSQSGRSLLKVMFVVAALLIGSLVLHWCGASGLAALVAGGPPLAVAAMYGGWLLVVLTMGKNARWN